jgi:hypothetical protein
MNLGSIEWYPQGIFESSPPKKGAFPVAAKRHFRQRFFPVLGVAACQQSASCSSTAVAAMTGRTASSGALTSLLGSKKKASAGFRLHKA